MSLLFGISIPELLAGLGGLAAVVWVLFKMFGGRIVDWWHQRRKERLERVRKWHRDVQDLLTEIRSVGVSVRARREVPINELSELEETTIELRSKVDPFPISVSAKVNKDVLSVTKEAAGLAFHIIHLIPSEDKRNSIADIIRHQFEMLEGLQKDTDVTVEDVLEIIDGIENIDEDKLDVQPEEAEKILNEFQEQVDRQMGNVDDLTIKEIEELPWDMVDEVLSPTALQLLVQESIDQYYQIALIDKPQSAKSALEKSEKDIFG